MTLLSELRSTEYANETIYSYLYGLKYEDRIDEYDIEVDLLNDVDRMLSRYFIRNDMTRYRRLTNLFGDVIDRFYKCEDCGAWEYEDDIRWAYEDNPICSSCIDN